MCNPDTMPRVPGSSGLARALCLCLRSQREGRPARDLYDYDVAYWLGRLCDGDNGETYYGPDWTVTLY